MKALLLQFAGSERMRQLGQLARIPAEWYVAEPRWPHFRNQIEAVRPDVIVLDLSRQPARGIDTADYLRQMPEYAGISLYLVNPTPAAARRLTMRVPGVPVVSIEGLYERFKIGS